MLKHIYRRARAYVDDCGLELRELNFPALREAIEQCARDEQFQDLLRQWDEFDNEDSADAVLEYLRDVASDPDILDTHCRGYADAVEEMAR